jgi:hypothetical protein
MTTAATEQGRDAWHTWRQCPCPPDLVSEIEEIARHRQCKPRKVVWELVREALRARRGGPRGKRADAAPKVQREPESVSALPPFVFRPNKLTAQ